jgi:amino acid transporter
MTESARTARPLGEDRDAQELETFGYKPKLHRVMGSYTSFSLGFAVVSITTGIFTAFAVGLVNMGGSSVWWWFPVSGGVLLITLVFAHAGSRIPLSGYAYQWSSRLGNVHLGWFTGWAAFLTFISGTAAVATTLATVFAPEFWANPTHQDIQILTASTIIVCFVINLVGIKIATWLNNVGATAELVGTMGIGLIVLVGDLLFFHHKAGFGVLFKTVPSTGAHVNATAVILACLLPVLLLTGWEGCADLAEETKDPRTTTPKTMIKALWISALCGFLLTVIYEVAIPHSLAAAVNAPQTPLIYILDEQVGPWLGQVMKVVAFVAILSCVLANMAVATRLVYSLARDNVLPGHRALSAVNNRTGTPVGAVTLIAVTALIFTALSAGLVTRIFSITIVTYYFVYLLTLVAVLMGDRSGRIPKASGGFSLGRYLRPVTVSAIVFAVLTVLALTLPVVNHISAEYSLGGMALGLVWWLVYLRRRLVAREVGPFRLRGSDDTNVPGQGGTTTLNAKATMGEDG